MCRQHVSLQSMQDIHACYSSGVMLGNRGCTSTNEYYASCHVYVCLCLVFGIISNSKSLITCSGAQSEYAAREGLGSYSRHQQLVFALRGLNAVNVGQVCTFDRLSQGVTRYCQPSRGSTPSCLIGFPIAQLCSAKSNSCSSRLKCI